MIYVTVRGKAERHISQCFDKETDGGHSWRIRWTREAQRQLAAVGACMKLYQTVISAKDVPAFLSNSGLLPHCDVEETAGSFRYTVREAYGPDVKTNRPNSAIVQYAMVGFDVVTIEDGQCKVTMYINTGVSALSVLVGPAVCLGFLTYSLALCIQAPKWHVENVVVGGAFIAVFLTGLVLTTTILVRVLVWIRRTRRGLVHATQQLRDRA